MAAIQGQTKQLEKIVEQNLTTSRMPLPNTIAPRTKRLSTCSSTESAGADALDKSQHLDREGLRVEGDGVKEEGEGEESEEEQQEGEEQGYECVVS